MSETYIMDIRIKRIYEEAAKDDGYRILVDRVWPRGMAKEHANVDEWDKDIAPSTELRKWFGHETKKFPEFRKRYTHELLDVAEELGRIRDLARKQRITLVYGAKDEQHNQAVVLREVLLGKT
ncbi:MAG: DUF488 domain-containing protein [Flavobacteriales bacterium]|nr:DUF488 domain-containing protein [Flavobacteriales bacterium]